MYIDNPTMSYETYAQICMIASILKLCQNLLFLRHFNHVDN